MKLIMITAIAVILSGCAEVPLTLSVEGNYGTYSYSAKRGVEIQVNATK